MWQARWKIWFARAWNCLLLYENISSRSVNTGLSKLGSSVQSLHVALGLHVSPVQRGWIQNMKFEPTNRYSYYTLRLMRKFLQSIVARRPVARQRPWDNQQPLLSNGSVNNGRTDQVGITTDAKTIAYSTKERCFLRGPIESENCWGSVIVGCCC
jgi:hypothetical protein